jgi:hypothetical protein
MKKISNRRKDFLIYKPVQILMLKIILATCFLSVFSILMASLFFYVFILKQYSDVQNDEIVYVLNVLSRYKYTYFSYVAIGLIFTTWLISFAWLKLSHKIAGPLYRMQTDLQSYVDAPASAFKPISLRRNDEMKDLAKYINEAVIKNGNGSSTD